MAEFDQFRDNYQTLIDNALKFSGTSQEVFTAFKADIINPLMEVAAPGDRQLDVLDVGCWHGLVHPFLHAPRGGLALHGVDVAADVIDWARTHQPTNNYAVYDGKHLPFESCRFDLVLAICVIHHVPLSARNALLAEVRRVVRPAGTIVVIEHNPFNPVTQYVVRNCPIDENAVLLSRRMLEKLLRDVGLEAIDTRYFIFTPFRHRIARSFDRMLGNVPFGAQYMTTARVPKAGQDQP